jgi:hypothetical protein
MNWTHIQDLWNFDIYFIILVFICLNNFITKTTTPYIGLLFARYLKYIWMLEGGMFANAYMKVACCNQCHSHERISAAEGWYLHCGSQGATSCRVHAYWACRHGSRPCRPSHSSSTSSPRRPPWIVIATWPVFASPSSSFSPIAEIATLR